MHICIGNLTIIAPDNGLSPGRRQAIIWTNAGILLIGPWGTNFSEILIGIQTFSFKNVHLNMSSAKRRPFCLGLNVFKILSQLFKVIGFSRWSQACVTCMVISIPNYSKSLLALTHRGRDKMAPIFLTTFSNAFSWMKIYKFWLRFHWSLFTMDQLTIFQHWFR